MTYYQSAAQLGQRQMRRNSNAVRFSPSKVGLGPISNALIVGVLVSVLGMVYLTQITKTNSYGYQIDDLDTQKQQLVDDNSSLKLETARLQALERIQNSGVAKTLEEPSNVQYINAQ